MLGQRRAGGLAVAGHDVDDTRRHPGVRNSSPSRSGVSGASSAGFSTTVQPVASAGPIFQMQAPSGPFQGMIAPTTPIGSFKVYEKYSPGSEFSIVSPWIEVAMPAYQRSIPSTRCLVPRVRAEGAPMSTRVEQAQLVVVLLDDVGDLQQQRLALVGFELRPRPLEGAAGRRDRAVDILLVAFGDHRQQLASRRVAALEGLARCGAHPLAIDQHAFDFGACHERMAVGFDGLRHCHGLLL